MMRRTMSPMFRTGHRNNFLNDVYKLSILEYLLNVYLGADVLFGMLVAVSVVTVVSRGGAGAGAASTSATATTATAMTSRVFILLVEGRFVVVLVYFAKAERY